MDTLKNGKDFLISYALKDGAMTSIADVERGKLCGCLCPGCNEPLIARKGKIKAHHFSHFKGSDCASHGESVAHWIAKNWFAENPQFINANGTFNLGPGKLGWNGDYFISGKINPVNIKLETKSGGFIPDVSGITYSQGQRIDVWIEIAVSHKCEDNKIQYAIDNDILLLECDVDPKQMTFSGYENYLIGLSFKALAMPSVICDTWYKAILPRVVESRWESIIKCAVNSETDKKIEAELRAENKMLRQNSEAKKTSIESSIRFLRGDNFENDSYLAVSWDDGICPWKYDHFVSKLEVAVDLLGTDLQPNLYYDRGAYSIATNTGEAFELSDYFRPWLNSHVQTLNKIDTSNLVVTVLRAFRESRLNSDYRRNACASCKFNKGVVDIPARLVRRGVDQLSVIAGQPSTVAICGKQSATDFIKPGIVGKVSGCINDYYKNDDTKVFERDIFGLFNHLDLGCHDEIEAELFPIKIAA